MLVGLLEEAGPLRMPAKEAADLMWAVSAEHRLLPDAHRRPSWSDKRAFAALDDLLVRLLLPDPEAG